MQQPGLSNNWTKSALTLAQLVRKRDDCKAQIAREKGRMAQQLDSVLYAGWHLRGLEAALVLLEKRIALSTCEFAIDTAKMEASKRMQITTPNWWRSTNMESFARA